MWFKKKNRCSCHNNHCLKNTHFLKRVVLYRLHRFKKSCRLNKSRAPVQYNAGTTTSSLRHRWYTEAAPPHRCEYILDQRKVIVMTTEDKRDSFSGDVDPVEHVLFQISECYAYLIPPRKSAASYRADDWDVNKWVWEGTLKVVSKEEECVIRLQDTTTGDLYAQAFLVKDEPHPVEPVIDSSRYFVLRVEETRSGDRNRHAFIGIGFRERAHAYDFQAALHDHISYVGKKKAAMEMEQRYHTCDPTDYTLKEGETIMLHIPNKCDVGGSGDRKAVGIKTEIGCCIKPPPPPPSPSNTSVSPLTQVKPEWRPSFPQGGEEHAVNSDDEFGEFEAAVC